MYVATGREIQDYGGYYVDFLCVKRHYGYLRSQYLRSLWATHDFSVRTREYADGISLFHRETNLADGVEPLVSYTKYVYSLMGVQFDGRVAYPPETVLIEITDKNVQILQDIGLNNRFVICGLAEPTSVTEMLRGGLIHVYVMRKKSRIYALYLFRDTRTQYEWSVEGSAVERAGAMLEFVGSVQLTWGDTLFYTGFIDSVDAIQKKTGNVFAYLAIRELAANHVVLDFLPLTPVSKIQCAYYTMNFEVPRGFVKPHQAFFMV
jgi:hypothetical protein